MTFISLVPNTYVNVKQYGALGDGSTDDTSAIAAAISAVSSAGGGTVFFPAGTYVTGTQTLTSKVHLRGAGYEASILLLKSGTNADLLSGSTGSISLSATYGTSSTGGILQFSIQDLTLDGNKANQSSGTSYPLRFYGYGWTINNVRIRNGYSGGALIDWNGGTNAPAGANYYDNNECFLTNFKIHDCNGIGLQLGGPHDSIICNGEIFNTGSHNLHIAPNALAMLISQVHCYSSTHGTNSLAMLVEGTQACFANCEAEGSDVVQVAFLANGCVWVGGRIFTAGISASGIQIGQQAGNTPYPSQILQSAGVTTAASVSGCTINCTIASCEGTNGSIWFANDGSNQIFADVFNSTGSYTGGSRNSGTNLALHGRGLSADGTIAKSGAAIFSGVRNSVGTIGVVKSGSAPAIANNGTITSLGVGMARVAPTGNVTGIILQAGSFDGQFCVVVNESANTVTFDVSGTSHVASGISAVIAAQSSRLFVYDTSTSLWY